MVSSGGADVVLAGAVPLPVAVIVMKDVSKKRLFLASECRAFSLLSNASAPVTAVEGKPTESVPIGRMEGPPVTRRPGAVPVSRVRANEISSILDNSGAVKRLLAPVLSFHSVSPAGEAGGHRSRQ